MFGRERNDDGTRPQFMKRACPRDGIALVEEKLQHVKIDKCPKCVGIWLDKNEIRKLTHDRELNHFLRDEVGAEADSPLICPSCGGLMDTEHVPGVDVDVDVCYDCLGIWLDGGELEKLEKRKHDRIPLTESKAEDLERTRKETEREHPGLIGAYSMALDNFIRHFW